MDTPVRVWCHTRGKRLGDCDGRSLKAVLDAIVRLGILPDDSAQFVKEVRFTQELTKEDQTVITLETIE
jgi:Holliday junction resolvase RusA-like endonuclease